MRARTWIAAAAASALAAVGLVGAGTAADAAVTTQPAGVTVTVDSTGASTALVSRSVVANLTVKNNSASSTLGIFTIVVPAGVVGPVAAVGVNGNGNWRQTVLPCAGTANCSALVLVYASLPLNTSVLKPGQSVTASIRFTTPAAPKALPFKFLGIGNGLFTTTDTPTINVINGVAGSYCVTPVSPDAEHPLTATTPVTAGGSRTFTVQAISGGAGCGGAATGIAATSLTAKFGTDDGKGSITFGSGTGMQSTPPGSSTGVFSLPASATGLFTFTATFKTAAVNQSFEVSSGAASGCVGPFDVLPAAAARVVVTNVVNKATGTSSLAVGAVFVTTYQVYDSFDNYVLVQPADVTIVVSAPGSFAKTGGTPPVAAASATTSPTDGTVEGTFSDSGGRSLTATVGAATTVKGTDVSFAAASTGSAFLFPGTPATIVTTGFTGGANPTCAGTGTTCAGLSLGEGGTGSATFGIETCTAAGSPVGCPIAGGAIVASLTANLKDGTAALYDQANPAHMTYVCPLARCPHSDGLAEYANDPNKFAESVEDFNFHPFKYVLSGTSNVQTAVDCSIGVTQIPYEEDKENHLVDPGTDTTIPGAPGQFHTCIDVHNLVRNTNGDLIYEVYFYDDYKGFVG